jgi:hypothetical protein
MGEGIGSYYDAQAIQAKLLADEREDRKRRRKERRYAITFGVVVVAFLGYGWLSSHFLGPARDSRDCARGAVSRGRVDAAVMAREGLISTDAYTRLYYDTAGVGRVGWATCMFDKGYVCTPSPPRCSNDKADVPPPNSFS